MEQNIIANLQIKIEENRQALGNRQRWNQQKRSTTRKEDDLILNYWLQKIKIIIKYHNHKGSLLLCRLIDLTVCPLKIQSKPLNFNEFHTFF